MYDFTETMLNWSRMCETMHIKYGFRSCDECPISKLEYVCCVLNYSTETGELDEIASSVAEWAKANPKVIYPTWEEALLQLGFLKKETTTKDNAFYITSLNWERLLERVPLDTVKVIHPTWEEALLQLGIIKKVVIDEDGFMVTIINWHALLQRVPQKIAEKLGIKPMEEKK